MNNAKNYMRFLKSEEVVNSGIGRFYVSGGFVNKERALFRKVLENLGFVPTRVEYLAHRGDFEYIGYSDAFEPIASGEKMPEYSVVLSFDETDAGTEVGVFVKKIEDD